MSDLLLTARARQVIADVAARHYCTPLDLEAGSREVAYVRPRQLAMYVLRKGLRLSFPTIGRLLHRDHTTVLYAVGVIEANSEWRQEAWRILDSMPPATPATPMAVAVSDQNLSAFLAELDRKISTAQALRRLLGGEVPV